MGLLIYADMEGICGIQSWEHTGGSSPLYDEGRRLYTAEVSAAVRGCLAGGARPVIVQDGHGGAYRGAKPFMNWIPDQLEPDAEYVRGWRWGSYVEPLETGECTAIAFVGAHARAGMAHAVLSHTIDADGWHAVSVNGRIIGESAILASIAGSFGVPAIAIAGDMAACDELEDFLGAPIVQAVVKRGMGRYGARMLAPADACRLVEERFRAAVEDRASCPPVVTYTDPVLIRVDLASPDRASRLAELVGVERVEERAVQTSGDTFWAAWRTLWKPS